MDKIAHQSIDQLVFYSASAADGASELARTDAPAGLRDFSGVGIGVAGVRRPLLLRTLVEVAEAHGVRVVFGHQLVQVEEPAGEERVVVRFANGYEDSASFVVGCDGLHSNTRTCLFGKEAAVFTGLTQVSGDGLSNNGDELLTCYLFVFQTGGISPISEGFRVLGPSMVNIYGDGVHMIAYPINDTQISWAYVLFCAQTLDVRSKHATC